MPVMSPYTVTDALFGREATVRAYSAREAAELGIDEMERNSVEFSCAGGETIRVTVTDDAGRTSAYDVTGRTEAVYTARNAK